MGNVGRKLAFVLASTNHGAMIINRLDYRMVGPGSGFGVGFQLLERAAAGVRSSRLKHKSAFITRSPAISR